MRFFTGLKEIGASAFDRCNNLVSLRLPASLVTIGENAFLDCSLRSIFIPAGVTNIASTAFGSNKYLAKVEVSPDNPVYDSREGCNAIVETETNTMISGSLSAFIPRSVISLSDECFNWFNRPEIIIPAQITSIGPWSFACIFQRVYCESSVPPVYNSLGNSAHLFPLEHPHPEIYIPYGSLGAYSKAEGWNLFVHRLHEYPARPAPISVDFTRYYSTWTNLDQVSFLEKH